MSSPSEPLLHPLTLADLDLPNRVIMAPMTRARANNPDLAPTELHATYYAQRASAGLIVTEGTWVSAGAIGYPNVPGIYSDAQIAGWRRVTAAVHDAGGRIFLQIGHTGAKSHPDQRSGELPAGPSAINPQETVPSAAGPTTSLTPRALDVAEIKEIISDFQAAAADARWAGFDGIEIHAQGPQLIGQFLNPRLNHRADDYGGTVENRARFLLEVVEAVTAIWDSPRIGVKMSPYWSNGTTFEATEETLAGFDHAIGHLGEAGASYLHLMGSAPADSGSGDDRAKLYERYRRIFTGTRSPTLGSHRRRQTGSSRPGSLMRCPSARHISPTRTWSTVSLRGSLFPRRIRPPSTARVQKATPTTRRLAGSVGSDRRYLFI